MAKSKEGPKKRITYGLLQPNKNTIIINIIWYHFTRYEKSTMKFK